MKYLPSHYFFHRASQTCLAVLFVLILCDLASAQHAEIKTNSVWLPLAELLKKWEGVPLDQVQGEAEKDNPLAQHYLGYCYMQGFRIAANPEMGAFWYRRGMTNGYLPSANNLGVAYEHGRLGFEDLNKAMYYYTYAAEGGYIPCQLLLYARYWDGNGVVRDHAKAMQWLTKAANAGSPEALYLMGYRCEHPDYDPAANIMPAPDSIAACRWYRLSADKNYAEAQYHLGLFYLEGQILEMDEERGLELVRAAADQEFIEALIELASLYARGVGEPRSEQETPMKLYERAHDYSHLILRYRYGLGTSRNMIAVAQCYVSLSNDPKSWFWSPEELVKRIQFKPTKRIQGMRMDDGVYWPVDDSGPEPPNEDLRFLSLYLKSSLGDGQSALEIANCYLLGKDAPKSLPSAWCWLTLAAQNSSNEATSQLHRLESQMDSETMVQARKALPSFLQELNKVGSLLRTNGGRL